MPCHLNTDKISAKFGVQEFALKLSGQMLLLFVLVQSHVYYLEV